MERIALMMRKHAAASVLLLTVMILSLFVVHSFAQDDHATGTYLVTDENGVKLYSDAKASVDYKINARKGAYLNIIKTDGDFGYTVYDSVYGWVQLSEGIDFVSEMPSVTSSGKIEGASGIRITSLPDKLVYVEGEDSADIDGLEVSLVFDDGLGSMMKVSGYTVSFPDLDSYGEKTVTVYYGGYSATFGITVVKIPVTGIVLTLPEKTSYVEGEAVSLNGLEVTAYFSDGRDGGKGIKLDESEYTVSGITPGDSTLAPGTYKVTVTYMYPEITSSFHIYVSGKSVTSLKLVKLPVNPTVYQGQSFDVADFELQATYDNGITETITDFNIEYDNMQIGTFTARIYYMDKYVAFDYTVITLEEVGIQLGDTLNVGSYAGADIDFSKLKVYVLYNSGESKLLQTGYTLSHNIDASTVGKYTVTVTYGEYSAEFEYTVADRPQRILGDVNGDGKVQAADARLALRASAMLENLDEASFYAADVDFDDKVNASDARLILRVSAGLESF